jgi:hypothetical protein
MKQIDLFFSTESISFRYQKKTEISITQLLETKMENLREKIILIKRLLPTKFLMLQKRLFNNFEHWVSMNNQGKVSS